MIGIDTNVLLRILLADAPHQTASAKRLISEVLEREETLYVSLPVLCETIWVLQSSYRQSRANIAKALEAILGDSLFQIESTNNVSIALGQYTQTNLDFPDILIGVLAKAAGCHTTMTFDRRLSRLETFTQLGRS